MEPKGSKGLSRRLSLARDRQQQRQQEQQDEQVARDRAEAQQQEDDRFAERFAGLFAQHWAAVRAERQRGDEPVPPVEVGESNFSRARVPWGVDLAAAWSWRLIVIGVVAYYLAKVLSATMVVVLPLVIALFIAALVAPLVQALSEVIPRGVAALMTVVAGIGVVTLMITFATQQVIDGSPDLAKSVVKGLDQIEQWLQDGPLDLTTDQIDTYIAELQDFVTSSSDQVVQRLTTVGATIGHIVAGAFIVLFATYFFLSDGRRIWTWMVRLFPRAARAQVDSSGVVAWLSLTRFVQATVLVALVDALGIMAVAAVLDVPFVAAIGVLVFLGAFVPLVGATVSGSIAVLVALVDQGGVDALLMLAGVIGVQQLEAHVLQPFLLGRFVSVHPLGVIVGIAVGVLVAGIVGALVAVPLVAAVNAVVLHLASGGGLVTEPEQPPEPAPDPDPLPG